jgi:YidC/Oxa1 family membrane protein insertase
MENKNTIIAIVLMLLVWFGFSALFPQHSTPPPEAKPSVATSSPASAEPAVQPVVKGEAPVSPAPREKPVAAGEAPLQRDITVDTPFYHAVFSNQGARLISLSLKQYQETADPNSPQVSLVDAKSGNGTLFTRGSEAFDVSPGTVYQIEAPDALTLDHTGQGELRFVTRAPSGVEIAKVYKFRGDSYGFNLQVQVANDGSSALRGDLELALINPWDPEHAGGRYDYIGPTSLVDDKVKTAKIDDLIKAPEVFPKGAVWTGFENKYFMNVGIPLDEEGAKVVVEKTSAGIENRLQSPSLTLEPGTNRNFSYLLYFGPRDLDILKTLDHQLAKAIDFGFFSVIATPLLHVLKFFYTYVGNYGIAIILITVIIKLLFWPLTQKSYASMKGMQKLQPEMQKIREKYKNDKERLNREMMELYKTHRVNPLGGCLPMVVQIPVFFALYRVLLSSIELRHAGFAFWLTDLSAKDPYYITPLIMGVTMFIQQRMTPSTMDPKQAKIFMLMPVVFTFLFLNFPSGLVIYWLVNNLLTILQQYFINRKPRPA